MGRDCNATGGRIMDDPNLTLADGYLSYDEQPSHLVTLGAFNIMSNTVSQEDFARYPNATILDIIMVTSAQFVLFSE